MARIYGNPPYIGTIGGITIYKRGEKYFARRSTALSTAQLKNPKRVRHAINMNGFGFSSAYAGKIRTTIQRIEPRFFSSNTSGQLTRILYDIQRMGSGAHGQQSIELSRFGHKLTGYRFDPGRDPNQHFTKSPQTTLLSEKGRYIVEMAMPEGAKHYQHMAHAQATHYMIFLHAYIISDYHYNTKSEEYEAQHGNFSEAWDHITTPLIPLGQQPDESALLRLTLPESVQPGQNLILTWGIEYRNAQGENSDQITLNGPRQKRKTDAYGIIESVTVLPPHTQLAKQKKRNKKPKEKVAPAKPTPRMPEKPVFTGSIRQAPQKPLHQQGWIPPEKSPYFC